MLHVLFSSRPFYTMDAIIRQTVREELRRSNSSESETVSSTSQHNSGQSDKGSLSAGLTLNTFSSRTVNRLSGLLNRIRHGNGGKSNSTKTLEEAEEDLQINYFSGGIQECSSEEASSPVITSTPQSLRDKNTLFSPVLAFSPHSTSSSGDTGVQVSLGDSVAKEVKLFAMMSSRMRQGLLQSLFYQYMFLEFNEDLIAAICSI